MLNEQNEIKEELNINNYILDKLYSGRLEKLILIRDGLELSDQAFGDFIKQLVSKDFPYQEIITHEDTETTEISNSESIDETAKRLSYPYYIYRKAFGAFIYEKETEKFIGKISEKSLERFDLEDGDEVDIYWASNGYPLIADALKMNLGTEKDRITVFDYALVEETAGRLVIQKSIYNQRLSVVNEARPIFIVPEKFVLDYSLVSGSVVKIAWENNEPSHIMIRKIYDIDEVAEERQKPKKYKKESITTNQEVKYKAFLNGETVGIVIGDRSRASELTELLLQLGGKAVIVDGFKKGNNGDYFQNQLRNVNLVVMVKNYIKHSTTKVVYDVCTKNEIPFSYANSGGLDSIARAIYRAFIGAEVEESNFEGTYFKAE